MNKLIIFILVVLLSCDFFLRVFVSNTDEKEWELTLSGTSVFVKEDKVLPKFNKHLFGEIEEKAPAVVKKKIENVVVKEPPFIPLIRAIYTSPEPYVMVALKATSPSVKLGIGGNLGGYILTSVNADQVVFEKQGNKKTFRIFKK